MDVPIERICSNCAHNARRHYLPDDVGCKECMGDPTTPRNARILKMVPGATLERYRDFEISEAAAWKAKYLGERQQKWVRNRRLISVTFIAHQDTGQGELLEYWECSGCGLLLPMLEGYGAPLPWKFCAGCGAPIQGRQVVI